MLIAQLFALASIFIFLLMELSLELRSLISYTLPLFVFFIVVSIRVAFDTVTFDTVFSNSILVLFAMTEIPLIDLIK